ncbi:MAG: FadR family transcriptional regulator [Chloroflexi bacterium]|uniref:FadR family transcriptional regulator n=1 Tax=Candidatus Chlorohelix allophototropha TaxID=3003348 RepID=A0A8T7LW07_9CHLR|nr:FadR family transcriptional regulator [Chloroflexota bacterium]WJW66957.1 FadR family transcriptional regulator [Chloroflexota bacterium L227-S17]
MSNDFALPNYYTMQVNGSTPKEEHKKRTKLQFETLKVPRASELVAEKLRSIILSGVVVEGQNLPPEKDLVSQLGVSRATLREALRMLETEGLISTKTGPKGGATVRRPGSANLTRSLALLLQLEETPFQMLLETRRMLQPICAELAAQRISSDELQGLQMALEMMRHNLDDIPNYLEAQLRFHLGIISAAHNDVLRLYTTSVGEIITAQTARIGLSEAERRTGLKAAESILAAIEAHDGALAARRVEAHLRAFETILHREK